MKADDEIKSGKADPGMFKRLRQMSLDMTPDQLGISFPPDKTVVFGVVMDWHVENGIMTLLSFQTGDASIYFSSGGGVIGGVKHEAVSKTAMEFVASAQNFLAQAVATESNQLPDDDCVKFYFLTNHGKFVATEHVKNFENNSSPLLALFIGANEVITALRETAEKTHHHK